MKSTFLGREKNEVKFTIEFTAEEFEAANQKAYLEERGRIAIDGFRKGKAPRSIIEKKYGESVFFETAIDEMLKDAYPKALDEHKLDVVDSPSIEFGEEKLEKGKGFTVTVKVEVAPEVTLKQYKGLDVEFEPKKIGAKDVKAELENLQHRNARLVDSDAAAKKDDTVVLDYKGFVGEDQFAGGTADGYSLKLGSGTFIPGFEDQLIGIKAGESRDVKVTFPKEYQAENLAGKEAVFKCTVHQVQKEELPQLDDEFAKDVSNFDTLDELKKDIKAKLEDAAKKQNEYEGKNRAMLALCEANPIDIPQAMIDDEVNQMYNEYIQRLVNQGISAEAVKKYLKESEQKLKDSFKEDATARVHTSLLVDEVSKVEKIEATDEELEDEFKIYADMYQMEVEKVKEAMKDSIDYIKEDVVYKKTVEYIYKQSNLIGKKEKTAAKKAAKEE